MHLLLSQELARQHREQLLHEAKVGHLLAQTYGRQHASTQLTDKYKAVLQARSMLSSTPASELDFAEIKRELQETLIALNEADTSSKELYIEAFVQKLKKQIACTNTVLLVQAPTSNYHRLVLLIALLCILMPLSGMVLGISQNILIGGCLLCLVGLVSTIIVKWA